MTRIRIRVDLGLSEIWTVEQYFCGENTMVHTRTIKEAAAHYKRLDPHTALTETAIRMLLRTGQVPSVKIGKKYLVTLEALDDFLAGRRSTA